MSNHAPFDWDAAIPLTSPTLGALLAARADQIARFGHTPEKDDAIGPGPMIAAARRQLLKALQVKLSDADRELQAAGDMVMGGMRPLDLASLDVLHRRVIAAGAVCLAIGELIDRERTRR